MRLHAAKPSAIVQDEETLKARSERFVADFALAFTRVSPKDIDAEIESWLSRLVRHLDADRSAVAKIFDKSNFLVTHSWARPGVDTSVFTAYESNFPWSCARVRNGAAVAFSDVRELPPDATVDRVNYGRIGIKSHLAVPLLAGGGVIGGFAVSVTRAKRTWSPETVTRMHLLGSVLANALARQESWWLQQRMQKQLDHFSRIGIAGEMAASLAHELTQPLAAILANAQAGLRFLARDSGAGDEITAILQDIVRDDKRAGAVISGLRAMMGKCQGERERVDMSGLVQESLAMLNMNIQMQHVEVRSHLEAGCMVYADKAQMQQVLLNLIINAMEAMQAVNEDSRQLSIEVRIGTSVHCSVRDSGKRLAEDKLIKIFEPFWTTKAQGMGMGLAVCRSIIDAHHGAIWAEIGPDGGTVLRFDLPKEASDVTRTHPD